MNKDINVYLDRLDYDRQHEILDLIQSDATLREIFTGEKNTISRLLNACYVAFIKLDNEDIGFVMIVTNPRNNMNEIDMGIVEKHKGKGYGTLALGILKDIIIENGLEVSIQTSKENIAANKSIINNGFSLSRNDKDCNYYVLDSNSYKR